MQPVQNNSAHAFSVRSSVISQMVPHDAMHHAQSRCILMWSLSAINGQWSSVDCGKMFSVHVLEHSFKRKYSYFWRYLYFLTAQGRI